MNKLFINLMLAFTPVMSTMASDTLEEIEKPQPVIQHMFYEGHGISLVSGFSSSVSDHFSPLLQLGHRMKRDHHGFDYRIQMSILSCASPFVQGSIAYQYYFSPELPSSIYTGIGASTGKIGKPFFAITPDLRIGKEFNKKGFVEVQFSQNQIPQENVDNMINEKRERDIKNDIKSSMLSIYVIKYMPDITISYGLAF